MFCMAVTAAVFLGTAAGVMAYTDQTFSELSTYPADGIVTVITDTEGEKHTLNGVIKAEEAEYFTAVEKIASYELFQGDKSLMKVSLNDIISSARNTLFSDTAQLNGYYSVRFTVSETENTEAFLTGLSPSNLDKVQRVVILAGMSGEPFSIESLDFIDSEKTNIPNDGDDMLCWAAAASNQLQYTGWGQKAGFGSEDDLLDLFVEHFSDAAGNAQLNAFGWFFNGINLTQFRDDYFGTAAKVKDYGKSGAYLKDYSSWEVSQAYGNSSLAPIGCLEDGSAVSCSISAIDKDGNSLMAHAVTLWGYICDKDLKETDSRYYTALFISDSDMDMPSDENRRIAPNTIAMYHIAPLAQSEENAYGWGITDYFSPDVMEAYGISVSIDAFTVLLPYSEDVPKETDPNASKDPFQDPDFFVSDVLISNDSQDIEMQDLFAKGDRLYCMPFFENISDESYSGDLCYTVSVKDNAGKEVFEKTIKTDSVSVPAYSVNLSGDLRAELPYIYEMEKAEIETSEWEPGIYHVSVTVNPEKSAKEAYYYNNTAECEIEISGISYDLSGVTMRAEIGEFLDGEAEVLLDYTGFDTLRLPQNTKIQYYLMKSCYSDGEWSDWTVLDMSESTPENPAGPPGSCRIDREGEKVKFRLAITGDEIPLLNLYSEEMTLSAEKEAPAYCVTTGEDISDPYDNKISLREAVQYLEESSETETDGTAKITFADGIDTIELKSPIEIDSKITIDGLSDTSSAENNIVTLSGGSQSQLFSVKENGELHLSALALYDGKSRESGGIIENVGGIVCADQCLFAGGESGPAGGALYSKGGSVILKNCSFWNNRSGYGGAIGIDGNAVLNMLNSTLQGNRSNSGAVYNNGGTLNAVYSTLIGNTASSTGGGAVTGLAGISNLVGCLVTGNGDTDLSGNVKVFGSFITSADDMVTEDKITVSDQAEEVILFGEDGNIVWDTDLTRDSACCFTDLLPRVQEGISVKNDSAGNIIYSDSGSEWIQTDIPSAFTDEEYTKDIRGKKHDRLFGSDSTTVEITQTPETPETPSRPSGGGSSSSSRYDISVSSSAHGGSTEISTSQATKGDTVTITVKPENGFELREITITDEDGTELTLERKDDTTYTFIMPASDIEIDVVFGKIEETEENGDDETGENGNSGEIVLPFTDVPGESWFESAVDYVYEHGLMTGTGSGTFSPNAVTTRGMIVTMLYRLEKEPEVSGTSFVDVADGAWYADAVAWAEQNDIVDGYGDDTFAPDDAITREQLGTIFYRYAAYKGYDISESADLGNFSDDSSVSSYAQRALSWANAAGLVNGMGDGTLAPKGSATRAQAAAILMRFCENFVKQNETPAA